MRISDWSSDVCSSDLARTPNGPLGHGYEAALHGFLEYDRKKGSLTRFDLVALGDVWGRWGDANGKSMAVERPGRNPVLVRSEARRVGKECVRTCKSRGSPVP